MPTNETKHNVFKIMRISAGSLLITIGVAGLVLPVLQGWLFLILGALVLSRDIPFFARLVKWLRAKFPHADRSARQAKGIFSRFQKKQEPRE